MLFQSFEFIIFLIVVFLVYWKMPQKWRYMSLLVAGYFFYSLASLKYSFLLLFISIVSFGLGKQIEKSEKRYKKAYFIGYIILVLFILGVYKYLGFATEIMQDLALVFGVKITMPIMNVIMPVGISFYLFQTLGYIIDVYNGKIVAEKHFGYFAVSVAFFPILLSGPIERIPSLTKQFREDKSFKYEEGWTAVEQIMVGYLKKLIIADSLSVFVDKVYGDVNSYQGMALLLVIILFSIQIYCDFSGYSDIAIGVAKLFGIHIQQNFRQPYFADSIKDFWRRWHISLSSWFRDYIYIPLGGSRVSEWKKNRNLLVTFLLSGLWHGAGWTFTVWGGMHGVLQVIENWLMGIKSKYLQRVNCPKMLKQIGVFILVSVAWIFFKANTFADGWFVLTHGFVGVADMGAYLNNGISALGMSITQGIMLLFFCVVLFIYDICQEKGLKIKYFEVKMILLAELALFYFMRYGTDSSTFIYFQF